MSEKKSESVGGLGTGIENTRLDVVVTEKDGQDVIILQLSTWDNLQGWQVEKTIPFEARQLGSLQKLLTQARYKISELRSGADALAQVISIAPPSVKASSSVTITPRKRRTKKAAN